MTQANKRSRHNREADRLTHSEPSSSKNYPDLNDYLHVWDSLSAGAPNTDQSHAARTYGDSLGESDTDHPKSVKRVRFAKENNDNMTEVRARAARHKGQMNFEAERDYTPC